MTETIAANYARIAALEREGRSIKTRLQERDARLQELDTPPSTTHVKAYPLTPSECINPNPEQDA
jgi:hypothetical protein